MATRRPGDKIPRYRRPRPDLASRFLHFGDRLTAAILEKAKRHGGHYTGADLARDLNAKVHETPLKAAGIDASTVGMWRREIQRPGFEKTLLIAEVLSVRPEWLAFGSFAHPATWPLWARSTWPETDGDAGEQRDRYRTRRQALTGG